MENRRLFCVEDAWASILVREDIRTLQRFCVSCIDYYQLHGEIDTPINAAEELFNELPQGKASEDKVIMGLFKKDETIIGIIEMIKGYPDSDCWFIGQMMINPIHQGRGLGKNFYQGCECWIYKQGVSRLRLGVLQENEKAYKFWQGLGFEKVYSKENYRMKDKETTVYVMEKKIYERS